MDYKKKIESSMNKIAQVTEEEAETLSDLEAELGNGGSSIYADDLINQAFMDNYKDLKPALLKFINDTHRQAEETIKRRISENYSYLDKQFKTQDGQDVMQGDLYLAKASDVIDNYIGEEIRDILTNVVDRI
jgi:hypothetical protein